MWHRLDQRIGLTRGEALIQAVTLVIGAIVGAAVSGLIDDPKRASFWAVVFIGILAITVCTTVIGFLAAFEKEGRERLDEITETLEDVRTTVVDSVDGSAVLVPRESIYPEMARCIREAREQVVVITYFMYDWENDKRTFQPAVDGGVAGVDDFYEAIYDCIKDPDVEYLRVWQVPPERVSEARSKIKMDARLNREMELIEEISPDHPDRCGMKVIGEATTASIVLVDRTTVFFNVDIFDVERGTWMSPFMLMVRDARGKAFSDLKRIVKKLTQ